MFRSKQVRIPNACLQVFLVLRVDVRSPIDELFHDLRERFEFSRQVERRVEALGDDRVGVRAVVQQENGGKFVIWNEKMEHVRFPIFANQGENRVGVRKIADEKKCKTFLPPVPSSEIQHLI